MIRRLFDLTVAVLVLTLTLIPLLILAVLIKFRSPGPVVYRQQRIGQRGRPFWLYKLRTMNVAATGSHVTVREDRRIYPLGRWLRRWKLDELPQFWNILRGEMSVVGPRPEVERFVRHYTAEQRRLLEGKPGLASRSPLVYPHEADLLNDVGDPEAVYIEQIMPRKIAVDLAYEQERTLWSDFRLMGEIGLLLAGKSFRVDRDFRVSSPDRAS